MKTRILLALVLLLTATCALGQTAPACNGVDATTGALVYFAFGSTTASPACTDYFGKANYANSPLPVGPVDTSVTGFTIMKGGNNYSLTPAVTITDFYGITPNVITCTATVSAGRIIGIGGCSASTPDFMAPVVNITDTTGSGAIVLAKLASAASGGMRKFIDPMPDLKAALGVPDTTTFPGSVGNPAADFYVIGLVEYSTNLHTDLPLTKLRGYCQLAAPAYTACVAGQPTYLGPVILAKKDRPVRVLFKNMLPVGTAGNLFIPVDKTYMGADLNPDGQPYLQTRATLHLHGGATPWISDGTPHQWTVPAGDWQTPIKAPTDPAADNLNRGVSTRSVPDMWFDGSGALIPSCAEKSSCAVASATTDPGNGNMTFYWTNQQGGRLMFYHDHAYGLTRLNVYVGEAAGYLLADPVEEDLLQAATVPGTLGATVGGTTPADLGHVIPLVIQDKSFVPSAQQLAAQDPTWNMIAGGGTTPGTTNPGDLWFPHVYMPNQNPNDTMGGSNAFGRWDYGAWFFPPQTSLTAANPPSAVTIPCVSAAFPGQLLAPTSAHPAGGCPITPNPSGVPEGFMDTPLVNGKAYPVLHVNPEAYRFHILSAANDRTLNLSLFLACGSGGSAAAINCSAPGAPGNEVPMVPAVRGGLGTAGYVWPDQLDGRDGGVPDSSAMGPAFVQIGTEGGLLPNVSVIPPTPVGFEYGRRSITVLNISSHGLLLGPAERADAIVDFSGLGGKTLILYNDAPAPVPAFDARIDYYTGDADAVETGGAPTTLPGYGPNTRTIMQIVVDSVPQTCGAAPAPPCFSLTALQAALPAAFKATQPVPIVPEPTYPTASGGNSAVASYAGIQDNSLTFTPNVALNLTEPCNPPLAGCVNFDQKAIQELFTLDYGRMNATMGTEIPLTTFQNQTTIPYGYVDWPTEIFQDGQTQLWKLTHNGVDTHFIHFHLFNVQVINRIGWDGVVKPPDDNELGWKDTVRMNPLEDIVFALTPFSQKLPFPLPDSIRSMDVTMPDTVADLNISGLDPNSGNATISNINRPVNFGWEYVWHCHILGHEENDMMRPMSFQVAPPAPTNLLAAAPTPLTPGVMLAWTDNSASETSFTVQRDTVPTFDSTALTSFTIDANAANPNFASTLGFNTLGYGQAVTFNDTGVVTGNTYFYRVQAQDDFTDKSPLVTPFQTVTMLSAWSNIATVNANPLTPTVTFTGAPASAAYNSSFVVTATTNSSSIPTITGTPGVCSVGAVSGTAASASATVTMTSGTGTCSVTANWLADSFFAGTSATQTTLATLATPVVTFTGAPANAAYLSTFTVTATTSAGVAPSVTGNTVCSAGTVSGTSPATAPITMNSGTGTCTLTANWLATTNYAAASLTLSTTATLATPTIAWGPLAAITYGTALSGTQLNATASFNGSPVAGTFVYTPAAGTVLGAGNRTLSVTFTATDTVSFASATTTVSLVVNQAPLSITASSPTMIYGGPVPAITPIYSGLVNGETTVPTPPTCLTAATSASPASPPTIASTCSGAVAPNYAITYVAGVVTINKATSATTITSNLPNPSIVGQIVTVAFRVAPQFIGTPTGNVTVAASTGETCTGAVSAGVGSCTLTFRTGGPRTLTATYAGDTNFLTSQSAGARQVVSGLSLSTFSLLFGNQLVGTASANQTVTLANVGTTTITISNITWSANFSDTNNCGGSLAPGRSCRINVRFVPTTTGVLTGTLTITDSDPSSPQKVTLTGTGVAPVLSLSNNALAFGNQPVRVTSAAQSVTVSNTGTGPLTINNIGLNGGNSNQFSQSNNCPGTLAVGASCTVNVTFRPTSRGTKSANITVNVAAPATSRSVALTGTGI
jgi:FtsP/CotA-like multicopper oxidase with cupredoxin domain